MAEKRTGCGTWLVVALGVWGVAWLLSETAPRPSGPSKPVAPVVQLPQHRLMPVTRLDSHARRGARVQVNAESSITEAECFTLLAHYEPRARPQGQVSVHRIVRGQDISMCVHNLGEPPMMVPGYQVLVDLAMRDPPP